MKGKRKSNASKETSPRFIYVILEFFSERGHGCKLVVHISEGWHVSSFCSDKTYKYFALQGLVDTSFYTWIQFFHNKETTKPYLEFKTPFFKEIYIVVMHTPQAILINNIRTK